MKKIINADNNVFKLIISCSESNKICVDRSGRISIVGNSICLDFENLNDQIGLINDTSVEIKTFHRNIFPFYIRAVNNEVWLSNDVSELLIPGEEISVRMVNILHAAAGSDGIRSVLSRLFEEISLLLPSSEYRISFENDRPLIIWSDISFKFHENMSKEKFLELLIDQYEKLYHDDTEVCLAISGGLDSRLELAILTHLKKKVHCYHYITSKREANVARHVAESAGATFHEYPSDEVTRRGWVFLKTQGYLSRWDGFFAPGVISAAGLYTFMESDYPNLKKILMSSLTGWKQEYPFYTASENMLDFWVALEEKKLKSCVDSFPNQRGLFLKEKEQNMKMIKKVMNRLNEKYSRKDIITDVSYSIFSAYGKTAARSTILLENGLPVFDGNYIREYYVSLPQGDKDNNAFPEWAVNSLNKTLGNLPQISCTMSLAERQFGSIVHVPLIGRIVSILTNKNIGESQDWLSDNDVRSIIQQYPNLKRISGNVHEGKPKLFFAQICRLLMYVQHKNNVLFRFEGLPGEYNGELR